jgi:predicted nucleotidyltransferase component of viral defense system
MDGWFALGTDEQRGYCEAAGAEIGLDALSIEKDFWVCWVLREVFALPRTGPHLTFKGGTSLSKGWKLIERFSEDLDIVIGRDFLGFAGDKAPETAPSKKQREARLEELRDACRRYVQDTLFAEVKAQFGSRLPKEIAWSLENDPSDPDQQSLLFSYPSAFSRGSYLSQGVKLEFGGRSDVEPHATPELQSYLAEAMPGEFANPRFTVRTVAPERTFWEKAMLLHEERFSAAPEPRPRMARHYYDLWCLIRAGVADRAVATPGLFDSVAHHRAVFFRRKKEAQESLRQGTLHITPSEDRLPAWTRDYEAMQAAMFFKEPPAFADIISVVGEFQERFNRPGRG